jgi:flavodoxin
MLHPEAVMQALIVYWTKTGHTERAGQDIATALREAGAEVTLTNLATAPAPDAAACDLLIVGAPCHAGSIPFAGSGIARPVEKWLQSLPAGSLQGKTAAAFSVHAGAGAGRTMGNMLALLTQAGATPAPPAPAVAAGTPFSLWVGPMASDSDRAALRAWAAGLHPTP